MTRFIEYIGLILFTAAMLGLICIAIARVFGMELPRPKGVKGD